MDLTGATNIYHYKYGTGRKLFNTKTIKELKTADILQTNGAVTVTKTMVFDLVNNILFLV